MTQADGIRDARQFPGQLDFQAAPEFNVGRIDSCGFGWRASYWQYDNTEVTTDGGGFFDVDAKRLDVEMFQRIQVTPCTSVEFSGGLRYMEFDYFRGGNVTPGGVIGNFTLDDGIGGTVGMELNHKVGAFSFYSHGRISAIVGDASAANIVTGAAIRANDVPRSQTEIGLGLEYTRCMGGSLVTLRAGYEWWHWDNMVGSNTNPLDPTDIGFDGFVGGFTVAY